MDDGVDVRYGHIKTLADAEAEGVREAGLEADLYQYPTQIVFISNN